MAIISILQYPDPRLQTKGDQVTDVKAPDIQCIITDMFETLYNTANCAGLAACQLDFKDPKRITVIDVSPTKNQPLCLVNPEIIAAEGETYEEEGCMSVPGGVYEKVKRATKIHVNALDRYGNPLNFWANDLLAKCIQHEIDHLNGKLFIQHLSAFKRKWIDKKLLKQKQ